MQPLQNIIRVLVVDDSIVARSLIIKGLSAHPRIEVVGYAINALDAKNKITEYHPDVITMDVEMPGISGIEFLKRYLSAHPLPVILVSSLDLRVFEALDAGAVDFVRKPDGSQGPSAFITALTQKVLVASYARVRRSAPSPTQKDKTILSIPKLNSSPVLDQVLIGLGASTGGTEATLEIIKRLPEDIPGMLIVQHMPVGFTKMYADRLNRLCKMEVREAVHGDEIHRGLALVAPADYQMRVIRSPAGRYTVTCTSGDKVSGHRPSVDVLFHSMAENVRCKMAGIILTGMGKDGAKGLLAMRKHGAYTIGQDKASSVVYGMPMVAYDIGAVQVQAACEDIASILLRQLNMMK